MYSTETLWIEFHSRLQQFVGRRVENPADVDDIVQDLFLRIHQNIDTLHHNDRLHAWVYQIARNAIVDYYRSPVRRRESLIPDALETSVSGEEQPEIDALQEMSACVAPVLQTLSARNREALVLTEMNGMTQRAAAQELGVSHSGMKSRVQRARKQMKDALLDCCQVDVDRRGGIINYEPLNASCECCASCGPSAGTDHP